MTTPVLGFTHQYHPAIMADADNLALWLEAAPGLDVYVGANSDVVRETVNIIYAVTAPMLGIIRKPHRAKAMLKCALVNLYRASLNGLPMRYSRNKNDYTHDSRYGLLFFKYDRVLQVLDALESHGYIIQKHGFRKDAGFGRQTRAWPSDKLLQAFAAWDQEGTVITKMEPGEVIILNNSAKVAKAYTDTVFTNQARHNLKAYNEFMKQQVITLEIPGDTEVSHSNLESMQLNSTGGLVSIDYQYPVGQYQEDPALYDQGYRNSKSIFLQDNTYYYSITNTLRNAINSEIHDTGHSRYSSALTFSDNYVFHSDVRGTPIRHIGHAINTLCKTCPAEDDALKKELRKSLREQRKLMEFGIGGLSLTCRYNSLHRVFNNLSFEQGGRFYGAYHLGVKRHLRRFIRINGEATVELDYSALHIRMLYHMKGMNYVDDPYSAICSAPGERKTYKSLQLIAINAKDDAATVKGFRKNAREHNLDCSTETKAIMADLDKFRQHHHPIAEYYGTGIGVSLQYLDSRIAEAVMIRLMRLNIPCLPVHDSFIVAAQHEESLRQAMMEEYEKVMGFMPVIG